MKLQRGGIREIEFIAQALQLAHGARDEWLRVTHTLISLGRLADRNLISEQERSNLSEAYTFLRTLEHRLQMEYGLQTHTVPQTEPQRSLVARRMNFSTAHALEDFERALLSHTTNVREAYDRVFAGEGDALAEKQNEEPGSDADPNNHATARNAVLAEAADESRVMNVAARIFSSHLMPIAPPITLGTQRASVQSLARSLRAAARQSTNRQRALMFTARVAASLEKFEGQIEFAEDDLTGLVRLCGASDFFGEVLASNPALIGSLGGEKSRLRRRDYRAQLRSSVDPEKVFQQS